MEVHFGRDVAKGIRGTSQNGPRSLGGSWEC